MSNELKFNKKLWELFTKKEEYNPLFLDRYQRFPYYLSKHKNVFEPEVSSFLIKNGLTVRYPNNKKFAVCLTHDIDLVDYSIFAIGYKIVETLRKSNAGKFSEILNLFKSKISKRTCPIRNFKKIMDLERKYDAKSSFYFLALDKDDKDYTYRIEDLKDELKKIIDSGWEVGLHGDSNAYNNLDALKRQKKRLEDLINSQVIGYRNHFLKFAVPSTWPLLEKAGFKYDTTFGYNDCVGFRNGMCHPFKPYDLREKKYIDILEIPLNIMDDTLFDKYMRLDDKKAMKITKHLIDTVEKCNGVITLLWHNTYMVGEKLNFYEEILDYCLKKNAWMTNGANIWQLWINMGK